MKGKFISSTILATALVAFSIPAFAGLSLGGQASGGIGIGAGAAVGIPSVSVTTDAQSQDDVDMRARERGRANLRTPDRFSENARVRSEERYESGAIINGGTIDTNTTATTRTREDINAGRAHVKKHHRSRRPSQHEIYDRATGLQNRADAGAGAIGGAAMIGSSSAFSGGARQKTDFNQ